MSWIPHIINALWFIIPAYIANSSPTLLNGRRPIDFGKRLPDGHRILGDGKTWEGFFGGIIFGTIAGFLLISAQPWIRVFAASYGYELIETNFIVVLALSSGTLSGDAVGSFIKRRFGLGRGVPAPLLDQISFVIGALAFAYFFIPIAPEIVVVLLLLTPFIHWLSCILGYMIGVKKTPW